MQVQISIALGTLVALGCGYAATAPVCAAQTSAQTIRAATTPMIYGLSAAGTSSETSANYRLRRIVVDPVLHRRWAWMEDCLHPERPLQIVALPDEAAAGLNRNAVDSPVDAVSRKLVASSKILQRREQAHSVPKMTAVIAAPIRTADSLSSTTPSSPSAPLVRAGDRVHLWSSDANVRMEIEVVALEYGHAGQVIHLRRKGQETLLTGVVVGPDSAELMP